MPTTWAHQGFQESRKVRRSSSQRGEPALEEYQHFMCCGVACKRKSQLERTLIRESIISSVIRDYFGGQETSLKGNYRTRDVETFPSDRLFRTPAIQCLNFTSFQVDLEMYAFLLSPFSLGYAALVASDKQLVNM